jgi:hypothetical protein
MCTITYTVHESQGFFSGGGEEFLKKRGQFRVAKRVMVEGLLGLRQFGTILKRPITKNALIAERYKFAETLTENYRNRTEQNVFGYGETLIIPRDSLNGRSVIRRRKKIGRIWLQVDLKKIDQHESAMIIAEKATKSKIYVVSVSGLWWLRQPTTLKDNAMVLNTHFRILRGEGNNPLHVGTIWSQSLEDHIRQVLEDDHRTCNPPGHLDKRRVRTMAIRICF